MHRRLEKGKGLVKEGTTSSTKPRDFTRPREEKKIEQCALSIPENFKQIGGNSDLSSAKIVFIAEEHSYKHLQDNIALLKEWARNGDILLIEAHPSMEPATTKDWILSECTRYGGEPINLPKQLGVFGWDDKEANHKMRQVYELDAKLVKDTLNTRDILNMHRLEEHRHKLAEFKQECKNKRDTSLLTTIDKAVAKFKNKSKIFVIAGSLHYTDSQEVQEAVAKHSSIVLQTTRVMTQSEIKQYFTTAVHNRT